MAKKPTTKSRDNNLDIVGLGSFVGGESIDKQFGTKYQFYRARHIDFRKNPTQFTVLPGLGSTTSNVVNDLVLDMAQVPSGIRYAAGSLGSVYKIATNGVWSDVGSISERGGAGVLYRSDVDMLYITGQSSIARIKSPSTAIPVWQPAFFQRGLTTNSQCYKTGGSNTYAPLTAIKESGVDSRTFISDIEPFYQIGIKVIAKGTGDWTLTLHDDANNVLGTVTVTNANLSNNKINYFVFSSPIRALVSPNGRTYHFHITSSVGDGKLATDILNSMANCDMELWANALVNTNNNFHPIIQFANFTLIGNERYVASYEPLQDIPTTSDYMRHRLTLPPGYEVCGFAQLDLYCAIAAEKRSSSGDFQEGKIFLWDGIQTTYNRYWDVPEGSPEALYSEKNILTFIANGALYQSTGGQPLKIRTFRNTDSEFSGVSDTTHVYPNTMAVRRGTLLMAYPSETTNQSLEHAIYSFGQISRDYPLSFGLSYQMSTGSSLNNGSNNLRYGMVKNFGDTLYTSWRDDSHSPTFGVDIVNNSSAPASTFNLDSLEFNNDQPYKQKNSIKIIATFNALPAGASIQLRYMMDDDINWTTSETATTGSYLVMPVNRRFYQMVFSITGTVGATSPAIQSLYMFFDPLSNERELG